MQAINGQEYIKGLNSIDCVIYSLEGEIIAATDYSARTIGLEFGHELIGYSYHKVTKKLLRKYIKSEYRKYSQDSLFAVCKDIAGKIDEAIATQTMTQYIDFLPYCNTDHPLLITLIPLLDDENQLIALKALGTYFHPFGLHDYFASAKLKTQKTITAEPRSADISLTDRQKATLSLALLGYSQTEIADILQISRGGIASVFRDSLCPKFNVKGNSMRLLLEKAREAGFDKDFPMSLFEPQIITLQ